MRIVKLRTSKPNTFWFMDNIQLTPFEDTSPPFDFDSVYEEGKQRIYSAVNVLGNIQIIDIGHSNQALMDVVPDNKPVYELPGQPHQYTPRSFVVPVQEEIVSEDNNSSVSLDPPELNDELEPTLDDMKAARSLLTKKVAAIEISLDSMSQNKDTRRFLLACIRVEEKYKKRKSVSDSLERRFLEIPPEVE